MTKKKVLTVICIVLCIVIVAFAIGLLIWFRDDVFNMGNNSAYRKLTYTALGDSITYGAAPNSGKIVKVPYCNEVGNVLKLKRVHNLGISGSTIAGGPNSFTPMSERYTEIDASSNIISVLGGINDYGRSISLGAIEDTTNTTFYGALNVLAQGLKEKYPNAFIFFMTPLPIGNSVNHIPNSVGAYVEDYVQAIKDVCNKYDVSVLDSYTVSGFEDYCWNNPPDTVHPDSNYHKNVLAPIVAQYIKENLAK